MYENFIRAWLAKGDRSKYSHLIIVNDKNEMEYNNRFVKRSENIKDVLFNLICCPNTEIKEIYNYDMDLEEQIAQNRAYNINVAYNKMNEAYEFAKDKHKEQTRKDGRPYITHPCMVVEMVQRYFFDHPRINELVTAAYLHDTVEDTDTTIEEIKEIFGEYVAYLVLGVTNDEVAKKRMGKTDYLCYKLQKMDDDVLNLKLCDRLANILDLDSVSVDFKDRYIIETTMILDYLLNNRTTTLVQRKIIKDINQNINEIRKAKILKLVNNIM